MFKFFPAIVALILANFLWAQDSEQVAAEKPLEKISVTGNGNIMFGQVVSGYAFGRTKENYVNHRWQDFYSGRVNITSRPNDWLTAVVCPEVGSAFPLTATSGIMKETYKLQYRALLQRAEALFNWQFNTISFMGEVGLMEYTFNPEVKNLGNYLYRAAAYPFFMKTKLDYPYSNLMGIRGDIGLMDNQLKLGLLVNSIIHQAPFYDISVGLLASYNTPNKLFDAGFGICFDRVFSVDDAATDATQSKKLGDITDSSLTLRSTKIDVRACLDLKKFLGDADFFGPNDAKIYGEAAVIGLKDPDYFPADSIITPSLMNRLPIMVGFNIPTFKILDLFSIELEYCKYPYSYDWWGGLGQPSPMPVQTFDTTWQTNYREKDNFKWTIYLKKSFSHFDVIAFFANDHMLYDTYSAENQPNTEQSLRTNKDWHWYIKLQYNL
jgi:hypothetical protein